MALQQPLFLPPPPSALPTPPNLFSLGDSYSAGIGAHCGWVIDRFDPRQECLRCVGSFAWQVANLTGTNNTNVYHIACTGSNTHDMTHRSADKNRTSQIDFMKNVTDQVDWGTLTIGGNDVGFGSIVANCIAFNGASCDRDLNFTEIAITDRKMITRLAKTYMAVLNAATAPNFTLIVPGYSQFFNANTKDCDAQYLFYGRYLTRELRARVNQMVVGFNLVIQIAIATVQLHLVFTNSLKTIYYEDWDSLFEGHRFCEEKPKTWADSWFFTIEGPDTLPNDTVVVSAAEEARHAERKSMLSCNELDRQDYTRQVACNMARQEGFNTDGSGRTEVFAYPWWVMKIMHPKSIAHHALARKIYEKWTKGEYFLENDEVKLKLARDYAVPFQYN